MLVGAYTGFYELPKGRVSFCATLMREIVFDHRGAPRRACNAYVLVLRTGGVWFCDS